MALLVGRALLVRPREEAREEAEAVA